MKCVTYSRGYSLIEALVAIAVLMLALVGPITIAAKSLQSMFFAREQVTALYLAQEGIEAITALRNQYYIELLDGDGVGDIGTPGVATDQWLQDNFQGGNATYRRCAQQGCNFNVTETAPNVEHCVNDNRCFMRQSSSEEGQFYVTSTDEADSSYRRVISVTPDSANGLLQVTVTVEWGSSLFASADNSVTLETTIVDYLRNF